MSDEKPFAGVGVTPSGTRKTLTVGPETFGWHGLNNHRSRAASINAAVAARERKAAAKALRRIAEAYGRNPGTMSHWDEVAADLISRAAAIEKGEA
jgi:hypothetical protein